jgi:hypothetical protein
VDRKDGASARCDGTLHLTDIDSESFWLNVHEDRPGTDIGDRPSGRHKGQRNGDDFVAWSNTTGEQRQVQSTCPGVNADAMANTTITRELGLKSCDGGPRSEGTLIKHILNSLVNLIADTRVLTLEIHERDKIGLRGHRLCLYLVK